MVYTTANQTLVTTDVPQRMTGAVASGTRTPASWVLVQALAANNAAGVFVGGCNPASKQTSLVNMTGTVGIKLVPGATMLFPVVNGLTVYDLNEMWWTGTTGDKISCTYEVK